MGVTHDSMNIKRNALLGLDALVDVCRVHGKGEIDFVLAEHLVESARFVELRIDEDVGITLHKDESSPTDIWGDEGTHADAQLTRDAVVDGIDLLLTVLGLFDDFLGTR